MDFGSVQVKNEPVEIVEDSVLDRIKVEPLEEPIGDYDYFGHELSSIPSEPLFPELIKTGSELFPEDHETVENVKSEGTQDIETSDEQIDLHIVKQETVEPTYNEIINIDDCRDQHNVNPIIIARPKKQSNKETRPYAKNMNSMECTYCGAKFSSAKWFSKHFCPQMGQQLHGIEIGNVIETPMQRKKSAEDTTKTKRNIYSTRKCRVCDQEFPTFSSMFEHFMSHYNLKKEGIKPGGTAANVQLNPGPSLLKPLQSGAKRKYEELSETNPNISVVSHNEYAPSLIRKTLSPSIPNKNQMPVFGLPAAAAAPTKQKEMACKECGQCFTSQSQLVNHFLTHYNLTLKKTTPAATPMPPKKPPVVYSCNQCPAKFPSIHRLRQHQQANHTLEEAVRCKLCDSWFNSQKYLLRHMLRKHEATAECNVCHQKFTEMDLPKHYLDHFNMKL